MAGARLLLLLLQSVLHQTVQAGVPPLSINISSVATTSNADWASLQGPDDQGNPVWKLEDQEWYIYYREMRWRVGDKSDNGFLRSEETGTGVIPQTSWEYYRARWTSGAGITVKASPAPSDYPATTTTTIPVIDSESGREKALSYYPAILTVTSHDSRTASFNGEYILVPGDTVNGHPIWKNGNNTISYKGGRWTVENSWKGFRSPNTRPEVFPETGWQYKGHLWLSWYDRDNFEVKGPVGFLTPGALETGVECYNKTTRGQDYTGAVNTTINGHSCKAWTDTVRPSVGNHSYCRNPTWGSSGLWCYTTTPGKKWEYCHVPECQGPVDLLTPGGIEPDNGGDKSSLIVGLSVGAGIAFVTSIVIFAVCFYLSHRSTTVPEHGKIERNQDYGVYGEDYEETEMRDENPYYGAAVEGWEGERVTDVNEDYGRV